MLAGATDKGEQIASEGSAVDRNAVTEQLQSLKVQVNDRNVQSLAHLPGLIP